MKMVNENGVTSSIPAFIAKLWHMVSDPSTEHLISWKEDGSSFVIKDHIKFAGELLPTYFKHSNIASFARQLNTYCFHKVASIESSSLKNSRELEFSHPCFRKDQPKLLFQIHRKMNIKDIQNKELKCDQATFNLLLEEVNHLRTVQEVFSTKLASMKKENAALWREHSILRQRHAKQEKIVNKVIQFLISMVHQSTSMNISRRGAPLMIKAYPSGSKSVHKKTRRRNNPELYFKTSLNDTEEDLGFKATDLDVNDDDEDDLDLDESGINVYNKYFSNQDEDRLKSMFKSGLETKQLNFVVKDDEAEISKRKRKAHSTKRNAKFTKTGQSLHSKKKRKNLNAESMEGINDNLNTVEYFENNIKNDPIETSEAVLQEPVVTSPSSMPDVSTSTSSHPLIVVPPETSAEEDPILKSLKVELCEPTDEMRSTKSNDDHILDELSLVPSCLNDPYDHDENKNHLDSVQSDLDVLKDILQTEGLSLDASAVMELFNDGPIELNMPAASNLIQEPSSSMGNELIAYEAPLDLEDIKKGLNSQDSPSISGEAEDDFDTMLNTPLIQTEPPSFPHQ